MSLRLPVALKERIVLKAFAQQVTPNEYMRALAAADTGDSQPVVEVEEIDPISNYDYCAYNAGNKVVSELDHKPKNECPHPSGRRVGPVCMVCHAKVGSAV